MQVFVLLTCVVMFAAGVYAGRHWDYFTKDE